MRQLIASAIRRFTALSGTLDGFQHADLIETVFQKTKNYQPKGDWHEVMGVASVLDFGGGCGVHYKQARSPTVRWAVVETPAMVERASELATDHLRFFTSVEAASDWLGKVDLMHSCSALNYTEDPELMLQKLCNLSAKQMRWSRIRLSTQTIESTMQLSLLGENGPGENHHLNGKAVRYKETRLPEPMFLNAHRDYRLIDRGPNWFYFQR